jgi:hypothetical protein
MPPNGRVCEGHRRTPRGRQPLLGRAQVRKLRPGDERRQPTRESEVKGVDP